MVLKYFIYIEKKENREEGIYIKLYVFKNIIYI